MLLDPLFASQYPTALGWRYLTQLTVSIYWYLWNGRYDAARNLELTGVLNQTRPIAYSFGNVAGLTLFNLMGAV
jgi:hypothetical protein